MKNLILKNQLTRRLISGAFAVRCAAGSRKPKAAGFAATTLFISDALQPGTRSIRAAFVPAAIINGSRPIVCAVSDHRRTKNGMRIVNN